MKTKTLVDIHGNDLVVVKPDNRMVKNAVISLDQIFERNSYYGNTVVKQPVQNSYLVYQCIQILADRIPKVPLQFFNIKTKEMIEKEQNEAAMFITHPGDMTLFEFLSRTIMFYSLYGESFWIWIDNLGTMSGTKSIPTRLDIVDPLAMHEQLDQYNNLLGWYYLSNYKNNDIKHELPKDKVIQMKNANPDNYWRGVRAINTLSNILGVDTKSTLELLRFYENFAIPGTILTAPVDSPITPEEMKDYVTRLDNRHQGAERRFKTAGFSGGIKADVLGVTQDKQQFIETKKWLRDTVLSVFNVPLTYAGYTEGINRATADAQERNFWQHGASLLYRIQETINTVVLPRIDPTIKCKFDYDSIDSLKKDIKETTDAASKLFAMGWSADDLNEKFNWDLPDHEGITDNHYKPFNLELIGEDDEKITTTIKPIEKPKDSLHTDALNKKTVMKKFHKVQNMHEKRFEKKFSAFFFKQRRTVLAIINKMSNTIEKVAMYQMLQDLQVLFDSESMRLEKMITPYYKDTILDGQRYAFDLLGITDREVILNTKIITERMNLLKGINDSTFLRVKKQVFDGVNAGETVADIATRIRTVYNFSTTRSVLIARTETASVINAATNAEYVANGVAMKEWLTSSDDRVRETCASAGAQGPISTEDNFTNGLAYPQEPNCRCVISPVIQ